MSAKNEQNIYTVTVTDTDGGQKQITGIRGILLSDLLHSDDIHLEMPCGGKGVCKKCLVKSSGIPILACQTYLNHDMSISLDRESVYLKELYSGDINISAKSAYYSKWGLAVDIGTTTIKITLVGQGGNYSVVYKNPHVYIGADVISRIEKALAGQAVMLTNSLRTIMREMILELCDNMKIYADDIDAMVVTGNTTMLYFLAGRNPESLAA
ncbi:MAG: hypothetical protein FWC09_11265, partial [Lachnospiraceae bacterium]|nr:hypothetical protein [Lachnospiraceae bacterium]